MSEMFPSKYLKAEEFSEGEERVHTIADVVIATLGEGAKAEDKFVLQFEDAKPLVLNKTNAGIIARLYGGNTDDWIERQVTLFTMEVDAFGDIVRSIRIRSQVPRAAARTAPAGSPSSVQTVPQGASTNEGDPAATNAQIAQLREAARDLWGEMAGAELRKLTNGKHPSSATAKVWLDRINDTRRKRDEAALAPKPVAGDPFDDDFDDSDPFADE